LNEAEFIRLDLEFPAKISGIHVGKSRQGVWGNLHEIDILLLLFIATFHEHEMPLIRLER
jgi:hypothetical protein